MFIIHKEKTLTDVQQTSEQKTLSQEVVKWRPQCSDFKQSTENTVSKAVLHALGRVRPSLA